jgi:hypothetical protein
LHSAIGCKTPNPFENEWFENNQITRSQAAGLTGEHYNLRSSPYHENHYFVCDVNAP